VDNKAETLDLLVKLAEALHTDDDFKVSVLITRLKQLGVYLEAGKRYKETTSISTEQ
jgi:hypothetical protein